MHKRVRLHINEIRKRRKGEKSMELSGTCLTLTSTLWENNYFQTRLRPLYEKIVELFNLAPL